jgi:hypothetical protein
LLSVGAWQLSRRGLGALPFDFPLFFSFSLCFELSGVKYPLAGFLRTEGKRSRFPFSTWFDRGSQYAQLLARGS